MSQVVRLDKISYPFPQTILCVDNNGNSVEIENGKFVTLLPQLLDYDVIPGVNVIDAKRGIVALHHTPPVPKPTKELEQDFLLREEKYGRAYILGAGDIVTIAGTDIENESGFEVGAEIGVSENGDIQIGKGQAIPFKLRALGTTSLEGVKAVVLRVEESALALGTTDSTAYRGDYGDIAYKHSQATGNVHNLTADDIGAATIEQLDTKLGKDEQKEVVFVTEDEYANMVANSTLNENNTYIVYRQ